MYTVYQVVLVAEDGEYVQSEWQTKDRANAEADYLSEDEGEGQHYIVRPFVRGL